MNQLRTSTVLRLFIAAVLIVAMPACSKHGSGANSNIDYWTCTMHPSVHAKDPGKCPICGMTLVPVMKTAASAAPASPSADMNGMQGMENMPGMKSGGDSKGAEKPGEFIVPFERQQQIGVTYATVETKALTHTIRAVGRVVPETQRVWRVVSRTNAYVQELGVNAPGDLVKKNQVLMKLYSP